MELLYFSCEKIFYWWASKNCFSLILVTTVPTVDSVSTGYLYTGVSVVAGILLLINLISVTVAVLVTRHCYKYRDKSPSSSLSKSAAMQDSSQAHKINEDIPMTENPAYGHADSTQVRDLVSVNEGDNTQRVYEDIAMTENPAYDMTK